MIRLQCECGRRINAPDQYMGRRVKCPKCGRPILVSGSAARVATAEAAEEPVGAVTSPPISTDAVNVAENVAANSSEETEPRTSDREPVASEPEPAPSGPIAPRADAAATALADKAADTLERDDSDRFGHRGVSLLGLLALALGIGAAATYFVPAVSKYFLFAAVAGVVLGVLGLIVSLTRKRSKPAIPLVAVLVCLIAVGLYWLPVIKNSLGDGAKDAPRKLGPSATPEPDRSADEARRRSFVTVNFLELTGSKDSLVPEIEYKLMNKSGKDIKSFDGSIQVYDTSHVWLTSLGIAVPTPVSSKGVVHGKGTWPLDSNTLALMKDRRISAEFRADTITYADGTSERFAE